MLIASNQMSPWAIAASAAGVFWTNNSPAGSVAMCPLVGCPLATSPRSVATGQNGPVGIALDAQNVYWTAAGDNTVMAAPQAGDAGGAFTLTAAAHSPASIVYATNDLLWIDANTGTSGSAS